MLPTVSLPVLLLVRFAQEIVLPRQVAHDGVTLRQFNVTIDVVGQIRKIQSCYFVSALLIRITHEIENHWFMVGPSKNCSYPKWTSPWASIRGWTRVRRRIRRFCPRIRLRRNPTKVEWAEPNRESSNIPKPAFSVYRMGKWEFTICLVLTESQKSESKNLDKAEWIKCVICK